MSDSKVGLVNCFFGDSSRFSVVHDETIQFLAGGGICLWNINSRTKNMIWSQKHGYCASTSNYNTSQIAAFQYGKQPQIHIFNFPNSYPSFKLPTRSISFECLDMAYSRDGNFLAVVTGRPDFSIYLYDLKCGREITQIQLKLPHKADDHIKLKFSPDDSSFFAILSKHDITFFTLQQSFEIEDLQSPQYTQDDIQIKKYRINSQCLSKQLVIQKNDAFLEANEQGMDMSSQQIQNQLQDYKILFQELLDPSQGVCLTSFIWDKFGNVILTSNLPQLYIVATKNLASRVTLPLDSPASCVLLTQKHLIVPLVNGVMYWMLITYPDERLGTGLANMLSPNDISYEFRLPPGMILKTLHYNQSFTKIIAGTQQNEIVSLEHQGECYTDNDDDQDQDGEEKKSKRIQVPMSLLCVFHCERVVKVIELPGTTHVASIDQSGLLLIWQLVNCDVIDRYNFPLLFINQINEYDKPSTMNIDAKGYILIVGFTSGKIRVLDITKRNTESIKLPQHKKETHSSSNLMMQQEVSGIQDQKVSERAGDASVTNPHEKGQTIRVIRTYNLFNGKITCIHINKAGIAAVTSQTSNTVYFIDFNVRNFKPDNQIFQKFPVLCHTEIEGNILGGTWAVEKNQIKFVMALNNSFICSVKGPQATVRDRRESVALTALYRRIDCGMKLIIFNSMNKDLFVTGDDKHIKKYNFPNLRWEDAKQWTNKPPEDPLLEYEGHLLAANCWCISADFNYLISGGKDGIIKLRQTSNYGSSNNLKAHHIRAKGVLDLHSSQERQAIYSTGGYGEIFIWAVGNDAAPPLPIEMSKVPDDVLANLSSLESIYPEVYQNWMPKSQSELMVDAFFQQQQIAKKEYENKMKESLDVVRKELSGYLEYNRSVEQIEQLQRTQFVINIQKEKEMEQHTDKICQKIRVDSQKQNLKLQLLHSKVKEKTYDTMSTQQRGLCAIKGDKLVFNFGVRDRKANQLRKLKQIQNLRRIEISQQFHAFEAEQKQNINKAKAIQRQSTAVTASPPSLSGINISSGIAIDQFSKQPQNYIINRTSGKQEFPQIEVEIPKPTDKASIVSPILGAGLSSGFGDKNNTQGNQQASNPVASILNKFKKAGKIGGGSKQEKEMMMRQLVGKVAEKGKQVGGESSGARAAGRQAAQADQRSDVEIKWGIEIRQKALDQLRKGIETLNSADLMYGTFQLFTSARKRTQIALLHDVIFELKNQFNTEYDSLVKHKETQLEQIADKNSRIQELLQELKQNRQIFKPRECKQQDPDRILKLTPEQIRVEKFLTKQQRAKLEKERLQEEARLRQLSGDTLGTRGVNLMMGGTLQVKKAYDQFAENLQSQEWMKKNPQQMNEQEKKKFKEYEAILEQREKQRKAWDQQLKKASADIAQISSKFSDKLDLLFKKKLFYDYRIYEQEIYIIRLTLSLFQGENIKEEKDILQKKLEELNQKISQQEDKISQFAQALKQKDDQIPQIRNVNKLEQVFRDYGRQSEKQMLDFVNGKKRGNAALGNEISDDNPVKFQENEELKRVIKNDPFSQFDVQRIKQVYQDKYELDQAAFSFDYDAPITELAQEHFEKLVELRKERYLSKKDNQNANKELDALKAYVRSLQMKRSEIHDDLSQAEVNLNESVHKVANNSFNIETLVRIRQLEVEVPQAPVATDFREAVLVNRRQLKKLNQDIVRRGEAKVSKLQDIVKKQQQLDCVKWEEKKLELEIKDLTEKALDVQMFRVTKEKQEILQGKHVGREKDDIDRLQKQIKQLNQNAEKRIETIDKKKKKLFQEIKERRLENEQLEALARKMQSDVEQRNQIMRLKSSGTDNTQDPSRKFKELAEKRKLNQIVKQRTEEIEFLRDELDRLRERTFPSFAHLHAKNEFPDEQA